MSQGMKAQNRPDPRDEQYYKFVSYRLKGLSDQEIAARLEFGSPEALYHRLFHDGYPVCPECGGRPDECSHGTTSSESKDSAKPKERKERKPRAGDGRPKALPPVAGATDLFREALNKLVQEVEELEHRRETYAGGRFVAADVYSGSVFLSRTDVGDEAWRELVKNHGAERVDEDELFIPDGRMKEPAGGDAVPGWPLPALIAAYLLAGEPLEPLLEVLHPAPEDADRGKLRTYVEGRKKPDGRDGLEVLSQQVAALIRGSGRSRGTPPPALTQTEQNVACSVTDYRKQGLSDEEIVKKFAHTGITIRDVRRLGDFGLSWPND